MRYIVLFISLLALPACTQLSQQDVEAWHEGQNIQPLQPDGQAPESWCYETLGQIDCYPQPQDVPPGRLVNVQPGDQRPLTRSEYRGALTPDAAPTVPVVMEPVAEPLMTAPKKPLPPAPPREPRVIE
jgi:hypothetical protein